MRRNLLKHSTIGTIVALGVAVVVNVGWADPESAKKYLEDEGYTNITIQGRSYLGCSDFWRTNFIAKNSRGITTMGLVCKGLGQGAYIRRK